MTLKIISVGKTSEADVQSLQAEYEKRLSRWTDISWHLVPNGKTMADESREILRVVKPGDFLVLLDERGKQFSTEKMSEQIERWLMNGRSIVFVIGGAFGVDETVRTRADFVWSFSELVFPHQLMRVLLTEQLYRIFNYRDGGKYHHQ